MILRLIFMFICSFYYAYPAKIIVFNPRFGYSHVNFMGRLADELQLAGHDVTVLQTSININCNQTGSKHARVIVIKEDQNTIDAGRKYATEGFWNQIWTASLFNPIPVLGPIPYLKKMFRAGCENMLNQKELLKQLRDEKYELGITELFDFSAFPLFHELGVKSIVGASTLVLMEAAALSSGLPLFTSYIPGSQSVAKDDGSLSSRLLNIVFTYCSYKFQNEFAMDIQALMNERYPEAPRIWDTVGNISIMFTNSDPLLDFPKPTLHKIVDLGGIGLRQPKPLNEDFEKILSLREKTVLLSFGSLAPSITMPIEMKKTIVKVLKKFPEATFIWKYEEPNDQIIDGADNIILTSWAPQNDLLADPRLSLFVTHGGVGSTFEGAARGVPLAMFPLFGDQMRNARMAEKNGFGFVCLKYQLLDEQELEAIIRKGLYDDKLRANAKKVSELLKKRPFQPKDLLRKYIDLALELGPSARLSPEGRNLSFIAHYNLDLIVIAVAVIVILLTIVIRLFVYLLILLTGMVGKKKTE